MSQCATPPASSASPGAAGLRLLAAAVGACRGPGPARFGPEDDDEERYEPTDPHPDTPDDFDEDAEAPRESEEAVREEPPPDDD